MFRISSVVQFCAVLGVCFVASEAFADLRVVATVSDLGAIAKELGQDHVDVVALALPTQDPHFVDARPNLALDLARADLLIAVGLDLEVGWLPTLQTGSRNGKIQKGAQGYLECSQFVSLLEVPKEKIDRAMGDIHPGGNPHYLYDPRAGARVAEGIATRMSALDPSNAKLYRENLDRFTQKLSALRVESEAKLRGLRGQKVIAYHRTLPYLADWLGFEVVEHVEPRPGIPPNPAHVAHVLSIAKERGARGVLIEAYYPDTTARLIAEKSGGSLIRLSGGADLRAKQSYLDGVKNLVDALTPISNSMAPE